MNERDITKLAVALAAGSITEDALLEALGDDSVVKEIVALAGTTAIISLASGLINETVDTALDIVDDFNPFSGW